MTITGWAAPLAAWPNRKSTRTERIAVGDMDFVLATKARLGARGIGRKVIESNVGFELKDPQEPCRLVFDPEMRSLSPNNAYFWDVLL